MRKIAERLLHFVLNMLLGCFPGERLRRVVIQDGTIKLFDIKLDADSIGLPQLARATKLARAYLIF